MSESSESVESDAARMELEPDALHEGEGEPYLDCPQCGAPVTVTQIIEEGRCPGTLDPDAAEVESEETPVQDRCTAELSLELVWEP